MKSLTLADPASGGSWLSRNSGAEQLSSASTEAKAKNGLS